MKVRFSAARVARGYTLIELVIVIALLGLAAAMLVPHLVNDDSLRVQAAVRQVIADLSFAQSDALANQEYRRVHFYDDGRGYCLIVRDGVNYAEAWPPAGVEYVHDPLAGAGEDGRYIVDFTADPRFFEVRIVDVQIDGEGVDPEGDVIYDDLGGTVRAGGAPGTGGTIQIAAGAEVYNVNVAPFTGKLTVSRP